jgi:hypothetical protein
MKKNLILYLIVCHVLMVCFFTSSCRPPTDRWPEQTAVYIYENKSGHSLQMQVYLKNKSDTLINIPNNDSFKETLKLSLFSSVGYDQFVPFSDSTHVIFDDNKSLFYCAAQGDKNAFYTRKVIKKVSKKETLIIFTFTESDYLKAE